MVCVVGAGEVVGDGTAGDEAVGAGWAMVDTGSDENISAVKYIGRF
jgi:hypothetical protein